MGPNTGKLANCQPSANNAFGSIRNFSQTENCSTHLHECCYLDIFCRKASVQEFSHWKGGTRVLSSLRRGAGVRWWSFGWSLSACWVLRQSPGLSQRKWLWWKCWQLSWHWKIMAGSQDVLDTKHPEYPPVCQRKSSEQLHHSIKKLLKRWLADYQPRAQF